jgi:hypothetical protein
MEFDEIVREWKGHRRGTHSLDIMPEGVELRDLDRTPTQDDPVTSSIEAESSATARLRYVRRRGNSF